MTESHPSSDTPIPTVLAPGLVVADKYELLRLIGQGGMGEVWAARHRSLGEDVAIKFLVAPSRSDPDAMLSRFQLEAQIAAHLSRRTRHIASVIDYGQAEGIGAYLVMELVGGTSLEAIIRRGQNRDLAFASMIVNQLAKGLSVAHDAGVVHRDLKPQNVMLTGGDEPGVPLVKILDFGLGKLDDRPTREGAFAGVSLKRHATLAGAPLGTPDYMSPEQVRGATDLDGRCDVWALAVVTYQLLTGVCPFEGDSIADTMFRVLSGKREPILTYRPDLPEATGTLFMRAFAPEIEDRFPSASSFASALQALVGDEAARPFAPTRGSSPPPGGVSRALPSTVGAMGVEGRGHRSHAGLFALTGIAFALLLGVLAPHARSTAPSLASGRDVRDVRGEVSALDVRSASAAVRPSSEAPSSTARAAASSAPFVLGSAPVAPVATLPVAASRATPRRVVPRPSMKAAAAVPSASGAATASPSPAPAATASSGPEHREDEAPYL